MSHPVRFTVNKSLIRDYDFTEADYETEAFRRFYAGRVLTRGSDADLQGIGLEAVRRYLPDLDIPREKREFREEWSSRERPGSRRRRPAMPLTFGRQACRLVYILVCRRAR